jgi:hypothetical protein
MPESMPKAFLLNSALEFGKNLAFSGHIDRVMAFLWFFFLFAPLFSYFSYSKSLSEQPK